MNYINIFILLFIIMFLPPICKANDSLVESKTDYFLSSSPDMLSSTVEPVKKGEKFTVINKNQDWLELKSKSGKTGWFRSNWVYATAAEKKDDIEHKRREATAAADERKRYASQLREHFLDQQLDIKVFASGSDNKQLLLRFVLFNDVWLHNFKKGSLLDEIKSKGFKRVELTDGYDWGYYFDLNK